MARTEVEREQARLLREQGKTFREISEQLGIPVGTISSWSRADWTPRTAVILTPPDEVGPPPEAVGRAQEAPPRRPPDGRLAEVELDYKTLEDYIAGFYKLGGQLAISTDPALGKAISDYAAKAGHAWAVWIRSEPKVAALLQRLMIGTPLGEVIGVHISIVVGYILGRAALRDVARQAAAKQAPSADGPAQRTAESPLGEPTL